VRLVDVEVDHLDCLVVKLVVVGAKSSGDCRRCKSGVALIVRGSSGKICSG
jgi:hypothetical protein